MNRKDLVRLASNVMRENNIRKPIYVKKQVFHISDDEGNTKDFVIKKKDTSVAYTIKDIETILNTCIYIIQESLKQGDSVTLRGFGSFGLRYRKARATRHPGTGEPVKIKAHYVPKFVHGNDLRMCAKIYELSLKEGKQESPMSEEKRDDGGAK